MDNTGYEFAVGDIVQCRYHSKVWTGCVCVISGPRSGYCYGVRFSEEYNDGENFHGHNLDGSQGTVEDGWWCTVDELTFLYSQNDTDSVLTELFEDLF